MASRSATLIVDHVANSTVIIKAGRDHVVEAHILGRGRLDGAGKKNVRMEEDAVDA
jgi:hypothetical protein